MAGQSLCYGYREVEQQKECLTVVEVTPGAMNGETVKAKATEAMTRA